MPMFPASVDWVGDMLRAATCAAGRAGRTGDSAQLAIGRRESTAGRSIPTACGRSSPGRAGVLLSQSTAPPATSVTTLTDALTPTARVTCSWRLQQGGGIVTTLAVVGPDAATIADAALRGAGLHVLHDGRCAAMRPLPRGRRRGSAVPRRAVALQRRDVVATRGLRLPPRGGGVGLTSEPYPNTCSTIAEV